MKRAEERKEKAISDMATSELKRLAAKESNEVQEELHKQESKA